MEQRTKGLIIAGFAGAVGGSLGSVSGSNSLFVVAVVSAVFAILTAWFLNSFVK